MALNAKKIEGKKFKRQYLEEPGTYPARLVQIISMGLQEQKPYKGQEKDPVQMLYLTYELLDEFMKDEETGEDLEDKPRWISESFPLYNLESDLATSTKRYYALDPECKYDGDWSELAGTPVMLTITLNKREDRIYENISGVSTMRGKEAAKAEELKNPPKVFDVDEPDMEVFFSLPQWLQDKIKENLEYEGSALSKAVESYKEGEVDPTPKKPSKASKKAAEKLPEVSEGEEEEDNDW